MPVDANGAPDIWSLLASIAALDVHTLTDDELAGLVLDAERLLNAAHALSAVALDQFDRRGGWADDGALSASSWVANRTGTSTRLVQARLRTGRGLRALPAAATSARAGRLSPGHQEALSGCARRHPDLATRDEPVLVEQGEQLDADAFRIVVRQWDECATALESPDPTLVSIAEPADELHLSRTMGGRYELRGSFSPDTGALLAAALDGEVDRQLRARRDGDPAVASLASQVRAAALVDLVVQTMRREPSEASVPDRYRVAIIVRADRPEEQSMAMCDSPAFRVVVGAASEVLDIGRTTQQWPVGIRRAITLRDEGCVFPGCDRPPSWCDIHHCQPWSNGGATSIDNGALLCRRHHTFVHQQRWIISVEDGQSITRKPDGEEHHLRRWDPAAA